MAVNQVQGINVYGDKGQYNKKEQKQKPVIKQDTLKKNNEEKNKYTKEQMYTALLAATVGSAAIVGVVMHGKGAKALSKLEKEVQNLTTERNNFSRRNDDLIAQTNDLMERTNNLTNINKKLSEQNEKLSNDLSAAIDNSYSPDETKIMEELRKKIHDGKLNYDVTNPFGECMGKADDTSVNYLFRYPADYTPSTARSNIVKRDIPKISSDGMFEYEIPMSSEVKVTKVPTKDFKPVEKCQTNILEDYADSVQWDNDKISRDLLQNFFDGHGQTLDGVRIKFEPSSNQGLYRVRIEGNSTYTSDHAMFLGQTSKRNNENAAGNYGEGLKMASLKLLREKGAKNVKIGSDNWEVRCYLDKSELANNKRVLTYSLDKKTPIDGNYLEFETSDRDLLEKLRLTIDRFYSSSNIHFRCPDFENASFGVKKLQKGEKGGLYISGQRFEFDGSYDGLEDVAIFIKKKPPVEVLDPSRDRTSINISQLEKIAAWLAKECTIEGEKLNFLKAFEEFGKINLRGEKETPMQKFVKKFAINSYYGKNPIKKVEFPEKYIAYSDCDNGLLRELKQAGYTIFDSSYNYLGMRNISEVYGKARKHNVVVPNDSETKKLQILKEAINKLAPALKKEGFSPEEIDTKIFVFDRTSPEERKLYEDALAEAIVKNATSRGFWIDKGYLNTGSFSDVLETTLHEMSHKIGGDYSADFSYLLTNVNKSVIGQILENPETKETMRALNKLWKEIKNSN